MHDDPPKQGEEAPDESFADILNEFEKSTRTAPTAKGKGKLDELFRSDDLWTVE